MKKTALFLFAALLTLLLSLTVPVCADSVGEGKNETLAEETASVFVKEFEAIRNIVDVLFANSDFEEALLSEDASASGEPVSESANETAREDTGQPAALVEPNDDSLYRVIVLDEDGNGIPGVNVQFCSDTACMLGETDETGTALFQVEKGSYTVHILKAPEEYLPVGEEFPVEEFSDVTICLYRQ